jgi:hypothetical protein
MPHRLHRLEVRFAADAVLRDVMAPMCAHFVSGSLGPSTLHLAHPPSILPPRSQLPRSRVHHRPSCFEPSSALELAPIHALFPADVLGATATRSTRLPRLLQQIASTTLSLSCLSFRPLDISTPPILHRALIKRRPAHRGPDSLCRLRFPLCDLRHSGEPSCT